MATDFHSQELENEAHLALHREGEQYNAVIRSIPCCFVATALGFRA
jgi:hypothetical protein